MTGINGEDRQCHCDLWWYVCGNVLNYLRDKSEDNRRRVLASFQLIHQRSQLHDGFVRSYHLKDWLRRIEENDRVACNNFLYLASKSPYYGELCEVFQA